MVFRPTLSSAATFCLSSAGLDAPARLPGLPAFLSASISCKTLVAAAQFLILRDQVRLGLPLPRSCPGVVAGGVLTSATKKGDWLFL
jgi:hypothetical protein